jgi:hypothetical protein
MKFSLVSAALLGTAVTSVQALQLQKRDNPSVMSIPFEKRTQISKRQLEKRQSTYNVNLDQINVSYPQSELSPLSI